MIQEQPTSINQHECQVDYCLFRVFLKWQMTGIKDLWTDHELFCYSGCSSWARHQVLDLNEQTITTRCPRQHIQKKAIPYPEHIMAHSARGIVGPLGKLLSLQDLKQGASRHPLVQHLKRFRYNHIPKGYEAPEDSFHIALFVHLERSINDLVQDYTSMIGNYWISQAPNFQWVSRDLFEAIQDSPLPPYPQDRFRWPHGIFFLPPGKLRSPLGANCPWICFAYLDKGIHQVPNGNVYLYDQELVVWTMVPETGEAFSAVVPTRLDLKTTGMNAFFHPGPPVVCEFIRKLLRLVTLFNITALHNPASVINPAPKKGKRKRPNHQPITWYTAPVFGLPHHPNSEKGPSTDFHESRRSYWAPGWQQRYRVGKKTDWRYTTHWRPPQYIESQGPLHA